MPCDRGPWSEPAADVDLEVTDPNGELAGVGQPTRAGLAKERDCPGPNAECHGQNLENVFQEGDKPLRGRYQVRIRLEALAGASPPIRVSLGARLGPKSLAARLELSHPEQFHQLYFEL